MELVVTKRAGDWLRQKGAGNGQQVALWAHKHAGRIEVNYQFKEPEQPVVTVEQSGLSLYVEFAEEWFFSGKQVTIDYQGGDQLTYETVPEPADHQNSVKEQPASAAVDASTAASRKFEEYWE